MDKKQATAGYRMAMDTIKNLSVGDAKHAYDAMMLGANANPHDADPSYMAGYAWAVLDWLKD